MTDPRDPRIDEQIQADLEAGELKSLREYAEAFPDAEATVATSYAAALAGTTPSAESTGARIGPYEVVRELGRGGQGVVLLARDTRLTRHVAIKLMHGWDAGGEILVRFEREARILSALDDPGICVIHDTGVHEGAPWIAMRFVEGQTLADLIARKKDGLELPDVAERTPPPPVDEQPDETVVVPEPGAGAPPDLTSGPPPSASQGPSSSGVTTAELRSLVRVVEKMARSLHVAHEAGITHRDIKPGNVIVSTTGQPVLLDFGLASAEEEESELTQTGDQMGTPAYMAPEQIKGDRRRIDRRTDIYALGVTLFECLTLRRPFEAPTRQSLYRSILEDEPPNARSLNRQVPRDLAVIIACALEKNPMRRYDTAEALAEDLRRFRMSEPIAARWVGPWGRFWRWTRRHPARATTLFLLIVGLPIITGQWVNIANNREKIEAQERLELEAEVESILADAFGQVFHAADETPLTAFHEASDRIPEWGEAWVGRALFHAYRGEHDAARQALADSPREHPGFEVLRGWIDREESGSTETTPDPSPSALRSPITSFILGQIALLEGHRLGTFDTAAQSRYQVAQQHLESAILLSPRARFEYHASAAHACGHCTHPRGSEVLAQALTSLWPDRSQALWWAAYVFSGSNRPRAIELVEAQLQEDPGNEGHQDMLAELLINEGKHERALEIYRSVDSEGADLPIGRAIYVAVCTEVTGSPEEAEQRYQAILERDPTNRVAMVGLGRLAESRDDRTAAHSWWTQALDAPKSLGFATYDDSLLHLFLGHSELEQGNLAEASKHAEQALASRPSFPEALLLQARIASAYGLAPAALARYREIHALETPPEVVDGHDYRIEFGRVLLLTGETEEAVELYQELEKDHPNNPRILSDVGGAYIDIGQVDKGTELLRRSVELDDSSKFVHYNLGNAYFKTGKNVEAEACFRRTLELDDEYPEAHVNLAGALLRQRKIDEALVHLQQGHRLGTARGDWKYNTKSQLTRIALGHAYRQKVAGNVEGAVKTFQGYVSAIDDNAFAYSNLAQNLVTLERHDEAAEAWEKATALEETVRHLDGWATALEASEQYARAVEVLERLIVKLDEDDVGEDELESAKKRRDAARSRTGK